MPAEKLYEADAYLRRFDAVVQDCREGSRGWEVRLDRTAFYPEGGGQPGDTGSLGVARVLDTRAENGDVVHLCDRPLPVGAAVAGEIDWDRRFDLMQQHSGEHIVSGLICARYACSNVGFHLGAETVVLDFDRPIPPEALPELEAAANAVIWEDRPFLVTYPEAAALAALEYRSKKALAGPVRIVECPGADRCACCGTHVARAGAVGLVLLKDPRPLRGGTRLELLAGKRAYAYLRAVAGQNDKISALLSARSTETAAAAERLHRELAEEKFRLVGLENRLFARLAADYAGRGDVLLFVPGLSSDALRRCCAAVRQVCTGRCAVFSGTEETGYAYAIAGGDGDLRETAKALNSALNGRGGGKREFVQGSVAAARREIENFLSPIQPPAP